LAHAFDEMARRVEETVETLRRFASDAAHELHTPLTALHTNLELMAGDETAAPADAEWRKYLNRAQVQLTRLETLTSDLLDLSRLDAGRGGVETEWQPVRLGALLREAGQRFASRAEQAGLTLALDVSPASTIVSGQAIQLRRMLDNLIDNALKFTPVGGQVTVGLQRTVEDTHIRLWVEDTGIGVPVEDRPHLFERFHRARNAAGYAGSGLGLAIVKAIVDRHQGQVTAGRKGERPRLVREPGARGDAVATV
jgi:signal transduction histidine kinase